MTSVSTGYVPGNSCKQLYIIETGSELSSRIFHIKYKTSSHKLSKPVEYKECGNETTDSHFILVFYNIGPYRSLQETAWSIAQSRFSDQ